MRKIILNWRNEQLGSLWNKLVLSSTENHTHAENQLQTVKTNSSILYIYNSGSVPAGEPIVHPCTRCLKKRSKNWKDLKVVLGRRLIKKGNYLLQ